jgi:hypothetical protein
VPDRPTPTRYDWLAWRDAIKEREGQERRDKDLSVVSGRYEAYHVALIRQPINAPKIQTDQAQKQVREATGEKDMQRHPHAHCSIGRHAISPQQAECRIKMSPCIAWFTRTVASTKTDTTDSNKWNCCCFEIQPQMR